MSSSTQRIGDAVAIAATRENSGAAAANQTEGAAAPGGFREVLCAVKHRKLDPKKMTVKPHDAAPAARKPRRSAQKATGQPNAATTASRQVADRTAEPQDVRPGTADAAPTGSPEDAADMPMESQIPPEAQDAAAAEDADAPPPAHDADAAQTEATAMQASASIAPAAQTAPMAVADDAQPEVEQAPSSGLAHNPASPRATPVASGLAPGSRLQQSTDAVPAADADAPSAEMPASAPIPATEPANVDQAPVQSKIAAPAADAMDAARPAPHAAPSAPPTPVVDALDGGESQPDADADRSPQGRSTGAARQQAEAPVTSQDAAAPAPDAAAPEPLPKHAGSGDSGTAPLPVPAAGAKLASPPSGMLRAADAAPAAQPAPPEAQFAVANHDRIISGIRGQLLPNGGTMHIRLDPPELGALQVTIRMMDGAVTASFETSNDQATKLLSHSLSRLKDVLQTQGVTVDRLHVQQSSRHENGGDAGTDQQQRGQQENASAQQEQQRREMLRRMWRRLYGGQDPLDVTG